MTQSAVWLGHVKLWSGWGRPVEYSEEEVVVGTFTIFLPVGKSFYLSSSSGSLEDMRADDELICIGPGGTITFVGPNRHVFKGPVDITSIMTEGVDNSVTFTVKDIWGTNIVISDAYVWVL
jgi:hypothetical protein